jgi:hypothetical protein
MKKKTEKKKVAGKAKSRGNTPRAAASPKADLGEVYGALAKILSLFSPPLRLVVTGTSAKPQTKLTVPAPVVVPGAYGGKPVDLEVAAVIAQKAFVGFYLMPLYMNPKLKSKIAPALLKLLKGKTCFNITSIQPPMLDDVRSAIELGTKLYRERGWL